MLVDLFGYEQFSEITGQHKVKGHFVDWAVMVEDELRFFVEVKALGAKLRDRDLLQVTSYSRGKLNLNWAVLTTGEVWQCHRVASTAETEQFFEVRILDATQPAEEKADRLYLLSREAFKHGVIEDEWASAECYRPEKLARILLSDDILKHVRRLARRESPGRRMKAEDLRGALIRGVIRGDVYTAVVEAETTPGPRRKRGAARALAAGAPVVSPSDVPEQG